jgi:hypothetical protein
VGVIYANCRLSPAPLFSITRTKPEEKGQRSTAIQTTLQMRGKLVSNLQSTKNQEGISATTVNDVDTRLFTQQIGTQTDAAFKNFISSSFTSLDITKNVYKSDLSGVDKNCGCYVCTNFTKAYLHHLFKQKELLGYTLATYHNLWVMEKFMEAIRFLIGEDLL